MCEVVEMPMRNYELCPLRSDSVGLARHDYADYSYSTSKKFKHVT